MINFSIKKAEPCINWSHLENRPLSARLSLQFMQSIAIKRKGQCLSKKYKNLHTRLLWQCEDGHQWKASARSIIHMKSWCPECAGLKRKSISEMRELALQRKGKCLSKTYKNVYTPLLWECEKGHRWRAKPVNMLHRGTWCHICAGNKPLTINEMRQIASSRNGQCLSTKYVNSNTKLKWKCGNGHTWFATPNIIKSKSSWCPYCAKSAPITIARLQKIAKNRKGSVLSKKYIVGKKIQLKCADGHTWYATGNTIMAGRWCHRCRSYNEEKCRDIFQKLLRRNFPKVRNVLDGLELDGYCKSLKLAFEYNGQQHYKLDSYFHGSVEHFKKVQKWDKIKRARCRQKGIKLVTIPYTKAKSTSMLIKFIASALERLKIKCKVAPVKLKIENISGNVSELKKLQKIASKRNITCLSKEYINTATKMDWQCANGHIWSTTPTAIKLGYGCRKCQNKAKHTIDFANEIAKKFNGKCLSESYKNTLTLMEWECERGHRWKSKFTNVFHSNAWCQQCKIEDRNKKLNEYAWGKGGRCVSPGFMGRDVKLTWECAQKHQWEARVSILQDDNWCPTCQDNSLKLTRKDLEQTAHQRKYKLLSKEYIKNSVHLLWQCPFGHQWEASANAIRSKKAGCPYCYNLQVTKNRKVKSIKKILFVLMNQ